MDLCMVHLQEMKKSEENEDPAEEDGDDNDKENSCDDNGDTVAEAFISMKVKKLKS